MERSWRAEQGIERVDYDAEYGPLADDMLAGGSGDPGVPAEAGTSIGVAPGGGRPQLALGFREGSDSAPTSSLRGTPPTPNPSRKREGDCLAQSSPLPLAGGGGGGRGAANVPQHTRPGPEPLLTRPLQARFCDQLARHGNVRLACRAAGVSAQTAYRLRRASVQFRALWDAALVIAREQVEDVLADRAVHGWEEAVFYHGEEVARRRRYDSRLLLAHLARLDRLADQVDSGVVARFDEALDALAADGEPVLATGHGAAGASQVPGEAKTSGGEAPDGGRPQPAPGLGEEGTPLLEAQLCWLEEHHGLLDEEEEVLHLLHTVPGVPGSALRAFGWAGTEAELAADRARWAARRAAWEALRDEEEPEEPSGEDAISPAAARC